MGVSLGLCQRIEFLQASGRPSGRNQPGSHALPTVGKALRLLRAHGPQPGEHRAFTPLHGGHVTLPRFGQICLRPLNLSAAQPSPDGGRRGIASHRGPVVLRPHPPHRQGPHPLRQGAEILHGQVIIGAAQAEGGLPAQQLLHRRLPARGKGQPLVQEAAQSGPVFLRVKTGGRAVQGRRIASLAPEGQGVHHPCRGQYPHAPPRKGLRRGGGPGRGQLQHQIRPTPQGHPRPGPLVGKGALPPLDPVAAHGADHGTVPQCPAGLGNLPGMSEMEGIIFGDDAHNVHGRNLQAEKV